MAKNPVTGTDKIHRICLAIKRLSESDFTDIEKLAEEQSNYTHPLKHGTANKLNDLGEYNQRVIRQLKLLMETIQNAPNKKAI